MQVRPTTDAVELDRPSPSRQTASSIVPAEIWLDVLGLCAPTLLLATTCRLTSPHVGSHAHRIWVHRHIFLNPDFDPNVVKMGGPSARKSWEIDSWYPSVAQCESHFAYYLKAHVPLSSVKNNEYASGLAPEPGENVPATVFSVAMVQWLFSAAGPFGKQSQEANELDVIAALELLRPNLRSDSDLDGGVDENDDGDEPTAPSVSPTTTAKQPAPPSTTWRLIPDSFLLASFFIRTSQLHLLEHTLSQLRILFPALHTTAAPFSLWSHLMLDNRKELRWLLDETVRSDDDLSMSYPTFMCFLALIDWSNPALNVVARVFADSFDSTISATLITGTRNVLYSVLSTLDQVTSPPSDSSRVLSIFKWLQANNAHFDLDHVPFVSSRITGSYPIFADVFRLHDLPNISFLLASDNPVRYALGSTVAQWVMHGHADLLHTALDNDLLDDVAKGRLLRHAVEKEGKENELMATVARSCTGNGLTMAILHALKTSKHTDPDPPNMYSALLNTLVTCSPPSSLDPTTMLIWHSKTWSRRALAIMMFDLPAAGALLFTWDYPCFLRHQLTWAESQWDIRRDSVEFMGRLIDKCFDSMAWDELDVKQVALACALRLLAVVYKCNFVLGKDVALNAVTVVDDKDVETLELLASLAQAKVGDVRASPSTKANGPTSFSALIPPSVGNLLSTAICTATSFAPSSTSGPCDCDFAHHTCDRALPHAIHNLVFDTLYALDRAFVVDHVAWRHPASVRVWHRFDAAEIASHVNLRCAIAHLRSALVISPAEHVANRVKGVVDALPQAMRESNVVVRGLRGLIHMKGLDKERKDGLVKGLDASRWGGKWREQTGVVMEKPKDVDDSREEERQSAGDCEEEEGEFGLFD